MSQYRTGTVTVSGESQVVLGQGTSFLSEVNVGDSFNKKGINSIYEVGSVVSDAELRLTSKYVASGESGMEYVVTRDFTPNIDLPEINIGDIDWPFQVTRAFRTLDTILGGTNLAIKAACRVATITDVSGTYSLGTITASGNGALSIDSTTMNLNDRVLVKNRSTQSENGIYYVSGAGSPTSKWTLTRATDFDSGDEIMSGCAVLVTEGGLLGKSLWVVSTIGDITIDTTAITFVCVSIASSVTYPFASVTDPATNAACTPTIIDSSSGTIIILTAVGNSQTLGTPVTSSIGKKFTVVNKTTSTHSITVNSVEIDPRESCDFLWDGSAWCGCNRGRNNG